MLKRLLAIGSLFEQLRDIKAELVNIRQENRYIHQLLRKKIMALPEVVKAAIATEIEEGLKLQETIVKLQEQIAVLESRPELGDDEAIVNLSELIAELSAINPTPISDAVISESQDNPAIDTPSDVAEVVVAPETVPPVEAVESAVDAIVATPESSEPPVVTDTLEGGF